MEAGLVLARINLITLVHVCTQPSEVEATPRPHTRTNENEEGGIGLLQQAGIGLHQQGQGGTLMEDGMIMAVPVAIRTVHGTMIHLRTLINQTAPHETGLHPTRQESGAAALQRWLQTVTERL